MQVFDYAIDDYGSNVSRHLRVLPPAVRHSYKCMSRHQTNREEALYISFRQLSRLFP